MKDKLTLQDIVDLLAKKSGLSKKDTDAFFREFLAIITDNIFSNEPVKVKDFGTFKLTKVNSRESVDVNSGEKIEIPAHYKLSFLPDRALKELVNKPFSQFETTLLEDAVSFDSIEMSEEPIDSPEDEDTGDDEVEVIRQPKVEVLPQSSGTELKRQKEDLTSKIESITASTVDDGLDVDKKTEEPIIKSEDIAPSPFVFSYSYTSPTKEDDSDAITLVVPSDKTTIAPKVESELSLNRQEEVNPKTEQSKSGLEEQKKALDSIRNVVEADDFELDSEVPLNINKVQEKIDQLKDAIEALEKISWQSEVPENALSTKPSVEEADIYNEELNQEIDNEVIGESVSVNLQSLHEETDSITNNITLEEESLEDVSEEISRGQMDKDLLQSLVAVKDDKSSVVKEDVIVEEDDDVDELLADRDDDDDLDDLDFFDYDRQSARKRKRKRFALVTFLLFVIGLGGYHLSKLLEHKVEYETYQGYYPSLTEGDTLPNAQVVQNLIDDLTLSDDVDSSDTVALDVDSKPIEPKGVGKPATDEANVAVTDEDESLILNDSLNSEFDKVISENLKIRVVKKGAYLKGLPLSQSQTSQIVPDNTPVAVATPVVQQPKASTIPSTAKIGAGMTLRNIAGKYYGHGIYWVYIFDENRDRIQNFDNVPAGLVVRLPDPKKYGINSKDSKSLENARRREQALFSGSR